MNLNRKVVRESVKFCILVKSASRHQYRSVVCEHFLCLRSEKNGNKARRNEAK